MTAAVNANQPYVDENVRVQARQLLLQIIHQAHQGQFLAPKLLHKLASESSVFAELWLALAISSNASERELILAIFYAQSHQIKALQQLLSLYKQPKAGDAALVNRVLQEWFGDSVAPKAVESVTSMVARILQSPSHKEPVRHPHEKITLHQLGLDDSIKIYLQNYAAEHLQTAKLYSDSASQQVLSNVRNNHQYISPLPADDVVVAALTRLLSECQEQPVSHAEPLLFYRYTVGQEFKWHHDYIIGESEDIRRELQVFGQRQKTSILYLNDGFEGGDTAFKYWQSSHKPSAGEALSFSNINAEGVPIVESLHCGTPVTHGEKWIATLWSRSQPHWLRRGILKDNAA